MEKWKDIPGYEGIYEASNTGKIRTHKDKMTYSVRWNSVRSWEQRELKQKVTKDSCHRVCLWKDNKETTLLVHRLVAMAFIEKIEGKEYINHLDGNRNNNHIDNLEWCDHKENNNHAFDNGLMTTNAEIVLMNKDNGEFKHFRSMAKASEFLGGNHGYLSGCLKREKNEVRGYKVFVKGL